MTTASLSPPPESVNPPGSSDEFVRAPFTYPGAKTELADAILHYLPEHDTYVEPFSGAASVLLNKKRSKNEVINDIDTDITSFMRVLRDDSDALVGYLTDFPYSEAEYDRLKTRWMDRGWRPDDPVKQAGQFFFLQRASFGGLVTGFRSVARGRKNSAKQFTNARDRLHALSDRLNGVIIRSTDWTNIIEEYASPETVFYLDPPYRQSGQVYENQTPGLSMYFMRHFDGAPNSYYQNRETEGPDPPEFLEMDVYQSSDTDFAYGTARDPLTVLISSKGPLSGLEPYTWSVALDYTHELSGHDGPRDVRETLTMNYDPTSSEFTRFGGQEPLSAFTSN